MLYNRHIEVSSASSCTSVFDQCCVILVESDRDLIMLYTVCAHFEFRSKHASLEKGLSVLPQA